MKKKLETLIIAALLSFVGGFLEIYSYILKDGVFATTITGDIVLIAYKLSNFNFEVIKYFVPIFSFFIGIFIAHKIKKKKNIVLLEILFILLICLFKNNTYNLITIAFISMISAMQIQTFQRVEERQYMSTMMTGNTKKLFVSILDKDYINLKIYLTLILSFVTGVIVGGIAISYIKELSILILLFPIIYIYLEEK